jgi:hypothetical protein
MVASTRKYFIQFPLAMVNSMLVITCLLKSKTGLNTSNSVVNRVIFLTLETALFPSISMVVAAIILHGAPHPVRFKLKHVADFTTERFPGRTR